MSKQDPTDQVKFLVSCIGHTTNGRPDFQAVANDLDICSKAAAQKRYERMLKSHGITTRGGAAASAVANGSSDVPAPSTPTKRKGRAAPTGSAKKRGKVAAKTEEYDDYDDDEDTKPTKRGSRNSLKAEEADSESPLSDVPSSNGDDYENSQS